MYNGGDRVSQENLTTRILVEDDSLTVSSYKSEDGEIVRYFRDIEEVRRIEAFQTVIKVGVAALKTVVTTENVNYVEKKFGEMQTEINNEITNTFGKGGSVDSIIDKFFGEKGTVENFMTNKNRDFVDGVNEVLGPDGTIVRQILDPNNKESPLYKVKDEIMATITTTIGQLKTDLKIKEAVKETEERTPLKGIKFQDEVFPLLADIVKHIPGDLLRNVTSESGFRLNSKKGDFVAEIGDSGVKLTIEAKDSSFRLKEIEREMNEALENRDALYGIFLSKYLEDLEPSVGYFNEYHERYLVIAITDRSNDEINKNLLEIAYKWGRLRVLQSKEEKDAFKAVDISEGLREIKNQIDKFRNVRKYATNIDGALKNIRDEVDGIEKGVLEKLRQLQNEVEFGKKE